MHDWTPVHFRLATALLIVAALSGSACDSGSRQRPLDDELERPADAYLAVDEEGMEGSLEGQRLLLRLPYEARASGSGTLSLSLMDVTGQDELDATKVDFDVKQGEKGTLKAGLDLPAALFGLGEAAKYKVRVEHEGQPVGVHLVRSVMALLPRYEVQVQGPARLDLGKQAAYRLRAQDPETRAGVAEALVELELQRDGEAPEVHQVRTDAYGDATVELSLADPGQYTLKARSSVRGAPSLAEGEVEATPPRTRVLLTTDKPIYQPGQTMHLRAVALSRANNQPQADLPFLFEVQDAKGNKVLKRELKSDGYGIAHTTFTLGSVVNLGTYQIAVSGDDMRAEKSIEVSRYALPKFAVAVELDQPYYAPGAELQAKVDARYFFGQDVEGGRVLVEASTLDVERNVFARIMGMTNGQGEFDVTLRLPDSLVGLPLSGGNALVDLAVTVTDRAGQEVEKFVPVVVASAPAQVAVIPEATRLVAGVDNRLLVFVSDPAGAPIADADVAVEVGAAIATGKTDRFGRAEVTVNPAALASDGAAPGGMTSIARVTLPGGRTFEQRFDFELQAGQQHLLVRTDKSAYAVGEAVEVELRASPGVSRVFVDWLNDGQAVDLRTIELKEGRAAFTVDLDSSLVGENRISAYLVDGDGQVARAGRTVFVRAQGALSVGLQTDKPTYTPGSPAELTFEVRDETGAAVQAAMGVQIVDEAVFGLVEAQPGLLRTYFELSDMFAEPNYQIGAPPGLPETLIYGDTLSDEPAVGAAGQERLEGQLAALGESPLMGLQSMAWPGVLQDMQQNLQDAYDAERGRIAKLLVVSVRQVLMDLQSQGCDLNDYWCEALGNEVYYEFRERLTAALADRQFVDLWGKPYRKQAPSDGEAALLISCGPDEVCETGDDGRLPIPLTDLGDGAWEGLFASDANKGAAGPIPAVLQAGAGEAATDDAEGDFGGEPSPEPSPGDASGADAPRVRREFPETLYVNPALITDGSGRATVQLELADSITQWRVSSLAHSKDGKLGGGLAGVTVFQEFFVDVDFPAELTRGDEVSFPVTLYNYLEEAQEVSLSLEAASWYTPLGETSASLTLSPGEVRGVSFPVRVEEVGLQRLTVTALGSSRSDAVERAVRIVPDGQRIERAQSVALAAGAAVHGVTFPADAVPGSEQLYLQVYPAFLSSVVSGMDSLLAEPNGCFEQTTSTTWPNVLVTRYMRDTDQLTPEIELKASALINAGYQRLLTFEHPGGGFSWFGTQDAAPFLSVTAFGLMEFVDMGEVHEVDPAMVERTLQWLLAQQQADGSWEGDQTEFFSFHDNLVRNTAFTAWSVASAGYQGSELKRALDYLRVHHDDGASDLHSEAMLANAFAYAAPSDGFTSSLLAKLEGLKVEDEEGRVHWETGDVQTCFYGYGNDSTVTTTALIAHAMLMAGGYQQTVAAALDYLAAQRDSNGNFGSTQATIWTLKTLLLAASKGTEGAVGNLSVTVDGAVFGELQLTADQADVMTTFDLSEYATVGTHQVELTFAGTGKVSTNLVDAHHVPWVDGPGAPGPLSVDVAYDRTQLSLNDAVIAEVTVRNHTDKSQRMVLVDLGIPPGFAAELSDLDPYLASGSLSKAEVAGRHLMLYLTEVGANLSSQFRYRLRATMPVRASDGGATVYPYYQPDQVGRMAAVTLEVTE